MRRRIARIDGLRDALLAQHPDAVGQARYFEFERAVMWPSELVRGATQIGYDAGSLWSETAGAIAGVGLGGLVLWGATAAAVGGQGRLARDARLTATAQAVAIERVSSGAASAPTTLADAAERVPTGAARVRVETYSMPDGSKQYAVYVAGMKDGAVSGGRDPWDNESNVQLWGGETSASYAATLDALDAAGAGPGDVVHAFGHSQGAMITSHLALEGGYDTRTLVSFGSPVEADVGPGTLSVGIRHTDDLVGALAGGGHAAPVGAAGSFIVERVAGGASEGILPAHGMASYAQTAALVDASSDPRVDAVRGTLAELGTAVSVEAVEYSAVRTAGTVSPSSAGGGLSRRSS